MSGAAGKRLYRVTVESEILVLADDESEAEIDAERYANDNAQWTTYATTVDVAGDIPSDWKGSLVYGDHDEDITAEDALLISQATIRAVAAKRRATYLAGLTMEEREAVAREESHAVGQLTLGDVAVSP